jgi:hypothetical protein
MLVLVCCWHAEQVSEWLRMVGLEELARFFRDAAVDGAGLLQLRQVSCSFSSILILQDLGGPEMFYRRADLWAFLCVTCGLLVFVSSQLPMPILSTPLLRASLVFASLAW